MTAGLFPDVPDVLCDLLAAFTSPERIGRSTPDDFNGMLPFIRVGGLGGSDDRVTDRGTVDVDVFSADGTTTTNQLGERIRQFLISGPHTVNGIVLDSFRTAVGPRDLPWATPNVFRSGATYRVSARRMTV